MFLIWIELINFTPPTFNFLGVELLGWARVKNLIDCGLESLTWVYRVCIVLISFLWWKKHCWPKFYFFIKLNFLLHPLAFNMRQYLKKFCFLEIGILILFIFLIELSRYYILNHEFSRFVKFNSTLFFSLIFNIFEYQVNNHKCVNPITREPTFAKNHVVAF